jgi:hypothetical protein
LCADKVEDDVELLAYSAFHGQSFVSVVMTSDYDYSEEWSSLEEVSSRGEDKMRYASPIFGAHSDSRGVRELNQANRRPLGDASPSRFVPARLAC